MYLHTCSVAYLAGKFFDKLWTSQMALDAVMKDKGYKDRLCVEIAGLCHDLGKPHYMRACIAII